MIKNSLRLAAAFILGFLATGSLVAHAAKTRITVTGSSTVAPLASELARRYESLHPDVRVDVQSGGSSRGIADARRGLSDIGMVSRALKPQENDLTPHLIARDGIGVIVHSDNPVKVLSDDEIVAIYTSKITRWAEVGGPDKKIVVVNKAEGRSTLELFLKYFYLKNSQIKAHVIIGDNQQGIKTVAGNPFAIGYVSVGAAEYEVSQGVSIKQLPMNNVAAEIQNVRNGQFPLSRELNLVTVGEVKPVVRAFIQFAQSPDVNDIVIDQFYVPIAD